VVAHGVASQALKASKAALFTGFAPVMPKAFLSAAEQALTLSHRLLQGGRPKVSQLSHGR
jgi:hypothetical protein